MSRHRRLTDGDVVVFEGRNQQLEYHRVFVPLLAQGRCFGRGDVLTEGGVLTDGGVLAASYAQEALLRFPPAV